MCSVSFLELLHTQSKTIQDGLMEMEKLSDAVLVPKGTTAKGLAFIVHSDLGEGFVRAIDGKSGMVIGVTMN